MSPLPTNQPTNLPPENYIAIRINFPHSRVEDVVTCFDESFCLYPHLGKSGENPHFHICVPVIDDDMVKVTERLRKRLKGRLNLTGNKQISCKSMSNCVLKYIQYASREGTTPVHSGGDWGDWISQAPKWEPKSVQTTIRGTRPVPEDHFKLLTYQNMKKVALRHRLRYNLKSTDMAEIHAHMIAHDNWDYNISVKKGGIPDCEYIHFEMMCAGSKDVHRRYTKGFRYTPQFLR